MKFFLQQAEFFFLSLLILVLPSFEAPKNFFLVFFVGVSFIRQLIDADHHTFTIWDWIFLSIVLTAFLTTLFPGMHSNEWKGFTILLTSISVGWLVSRSQFQTKSLRWFFALIILATIPPLIVGLAKYLYLHSNPDLQLHSVGHVNHSAIYLTMVLGASVGALIAIWEKITLLQRILMGLLNILFFVSLFISQSRAAVGIGALLSVLLFLILARDNKIKLAGILSVSILMMMAIFLNIGVVQKELRNEQKNDILGARDKVWNISFEALRWAPIFGIGINNWGKIKPEQIKHSVEARGKIYNEKNYLFQGHSHSIYLMALVERGIIGFSALIFLMLGWIYYLIAKFKNISKDSQGRYLWAGSFSAWLATFGIGFVNTTFHHEHGILACILLGLFVSYMTFNKKTIPGK